MNRRTFSLSRNILPSLLFAAVMISAGLGETAFAQRQLLDFHDKKRANSVEVEAIFKNGVNSGFLPVRVTIRNATPEEKTWTVRFNYSLGQSTRTSDFTIKVDKQSEVVKELYVPVPLVTRDSAYGALNTSASAPGGGSSERQENWMYSTEWPGIVISQKLGKTTPELDKEMRGKGSYSSNEFGGLFDPEHLPSDWRGYIGTDVLMIDKTEWEVVPTGPRKAIREWVRMGGRLDIYTTSDGDSPADFGFPDADLITNNIHYFSLGNVRVKKWNGTQLNAVQTVRYYSSVKNQSKNYAEDFDSSNKWQLQKAFGKSDDNEVMVFILLVAFGIMVGPINLFVLAKPGQRHKLFITTPIIAIIASLAILALIFLKDGVGGEGQRIAFANLQPGQEKRIYLIQEQISRSGVLLSTAFDPSEDVFITPVRMAHSKWNRTSSGGNYFRGNFKTRGNIESGDWFQSRSVQGQSLEAVRPTRSRIELRTAASSDGSTAPKLFSSLEFSVRDFYYRDRHGNVWQSTAGTIAPGNDIPLKRLKITNELDNWWRDQTKNFSDGVRKRIRKLDDRRGHFFCVTDDPKANLIKTLDSIRWKNDFVVMCGAVTEENAN